LNANYLIPQTAGYGTFPVSWLSHTTASVNETRTSERTKINESRIVRESFDAKRARPNHATAGTQGILLPPRLRNEGYTRGTRENSEAELNERKGDGLVRKVGFEPTRLTAPPPQDGASASSATSARGEVKTQVAISGNSKPSLLIPGRLFRLRRGWRRRDGGRLSRSRGRRRCGGRCSWRSRWGGL
jgi:hypothetical protein